jgi:hypothetical protein
MNIVHVSDFKYKVKMYGMSIVHVSDFKYKVKMYGMNNIKFINVRQSKEIYQFVHDIDSALM